MAVLKVSNGQDTFEVDDSRLDEAKKDGFVPLIKVTNGTETHDVHPNDLHLAEADGYKPEDISTAGKDRTLKQKAIEIVGNTVGGGVLGSLLSYKPTTQAIAEGLPLAGAVGGGMLGAAGTIMTGPGAVGGGMLGAGLGAGLGEAGKQLIQEHILEEPPKSLSQKASDIATQGVYGAAGEGSGLLLSKGIQKVAPTLGKLFTISGEKATAPAIKEATEAIGAKPTMGMLSDSPYMQKIESSLEQSPSISGALVRQETSPVRNAVKTTANNVFADIPNVQPSDVGAKVKEGFSQVINDRLAPLRESYDNIRESTGNISVAPKSINSVARNIENIDTLKSSPASSTLKTIAEDLRNVKNADELKKLRSNIGSGLSSKDLDPREKAALSAAYSKISNLENNSIMRSAIENAGNTNRGKAIAKGLITQLKDTNKQWGGLIEEIGDISLNAGTGKNLKTVTQFINKLDEIPDEKIVDTFFKTNNRAQLQRIESTFPEQFKAMREAKLDNIRRQVETRGEVSPRKLLTVVKGIEPDTQKILFGPDATQKIKHMETVLNSMPEMVGPSGTPGGLEWLNFLGPSSLVKEPGRAAQYGILKGADKINNMASGLISAGKSPNVETLTKFGTKAGLLRKQ